jgi:copper oxidase (laccase) domain-containing protein
MSDQILYEKNLLRGRFIVYGKKPEFDFLKVKQIHSAHILPESSCMNLEADGIVGTTNVPKVILTADCVPIVLIGEKAHATVHAGWRGLHSKILAHESIKSIKPYYAFIGPHIRQNNYEVQPDFLANFPENQDAFSRVSDKIFFNLETVTVAQLKSLYPGIQIEDCGLDTFSDSKFHSYRRDSKSPERNWNIYIP